MQWISSLPIGYLACVKGSCFCRLRLVVHCFLVAHIQLRENRFNLVYGFATLFDFSAGEVDILQYFNTLKYSSFCCIATYINTWRLIFVIIITNYLVLLQMKMMLSRNPDWFISVQCTSSAHKLHLIFVTCGKVSLVACYCLFTQKCWWIKLISCGKFFMMDFQVLHWRSTESDFIIYCSQ